MRSLSAARFGWALSLVTLVLLSSPGEVLGQHLYLDTNGDGLNTAADVVDPAAGAVVEVWLDTARNRDGSPAACASAGEPTLSSYELVLVTSGGTVTWGTFTNRLAGFTVSLGTASSSTEFRAGFGVNSTSKSLRPGLYRLGTLNVTAASGAPALGFAAVSTLGAEHLTAFGSACLGADFDQTMKLGTDWLDADGAASGATVPPTGQPPLLTAPSGMTVAEGGVADQALSATDPDGQPMNFSALAGPSYMTVSTTSPGSGSATGNLHLAPGLSDAGSTMATVGVSDGTLRAMATLSITVTNLNQAPLLAQPADMGATIGRAAVSQDIAAADPDGDPITFSKSSGPSFVTVTTTSTSPSGSTGQILVQPLAEDVPAVYSATVQASDGTLADAKSLNVSAVRFPALSVTTGSVYDAFVGRTLTFPVRAVPPGVGVATISVSNAPAGASLVDNHDNSAALIWTPTPDQLGGLYWVTLRGDNNFGGVAEEVVWFRVLAPPVDHPPQVTAPATVEVNEGGPIQFAVSVSDPDGDAIAWLGAAPIPAGAAFTENASHTAGTFNWVPTYSQSGSYSVTFTATNALSGSSTTSITVNDSEPRIVREDFYAANGPVLATAVSGGTLYIGGDFTQVGPATGGAAPIDVASGELLSGFPKVAGTVATAVPDGSGGWYLGGEFTSVGGIARSNAAHVLADNSVSGWNPGANGPVGALVMSGSTVYAAGKFTAIGGQGRNRIAALDATTGLATAWDPNADNVVYAIALSGATVYVAGGFTAVGGQPRNRIAALDATTGLATAWDPNSDNIVYAMALSGSAVYAAGKFTAIGGQARNHIAALDATTGLATPWDPSPNSDVTILLVDGTTVYACGGFTMIGGQLRSGIAALDATTGLATPWDPHPNRNVTALAGGGTTVYAGGWFTIIGTLERNHIAALDTETGLATAWNPNANGGVQTLFVSGTTVFAGGSLTGVGWQRRDHIAALDATTGLLTPWAPDADATVRTLAVNGPTVYAGGDFIFIGGQARNRLAAIDATSGLSTSWDPGANWPVGALAVSGTTIYAGGGFTNIGGQPRNWIAALDATTGLATPWNPNADSAVDALAVDGTTIYAGGGFTNIGGQPRNRIAALDAATGLATPWNPGANGRVYALAVDGPRIYAGGGFTSIGAQARNYVAALDAATGLATAWNPNAGDQVMALRADGDVVYAGGDFTTIGGQPRNHIAALEAPFGLASAWDPNANYPVLSLQTSGRAVYAGGSFSQAGGSPQQGLACIFAPDRGPAIVAPDVVSGEEGGSVSFTISVTDPDGDPIQGLTVDLSSLPPGNDATFTPTGRGSGGGTFLWHPATGTAGTYAVPLTAWNAITQTDTTRISVAEFGSTTTGDLTWNPAPTDVGGYIVTFKAIRTEPVYEEATATTAVTVISGSSGAPSIRRSVARAPLASMKGPVISAPATAQVSVGGTLVVEVSATGADSLAADLSGLPSDNTATFTVDHEPEVAAPANWAVEPGEMVTFPVTARDPDGDAILALTSDLTKLPPGHDATFVAGEGDTSGTFSWTPSLSDSGTFVVSFEAQNALVRYATTAISVRSGLAGYWALNGNGEDGARGNALAAAGSVTYVGGWLGQAADIDGSVTGSRLTAPATSSYDFQAGFTVEAWVNARSPGYSSEPFLVGASSPGGEFSWELYLCGPGGGGPPGAVGARIRGSGGEFVVASSIPVVDGLFHHVAMTYDGATIRLYVNGAPNTLLAQGGLTAPVNGGVLSMGATAAGQQFDGVLDDVRIYRMARSAQQIQRDMSHELGYPTGTGGGAPRYANQLQQNRPNPFNPATIIGFELERAGRVRLDVFDVGGRHVARLLDRELSAGPHSVAWSGSDGRGRRVASGVYLYRLTAGAFTHTRAMVLLK